MHAQTLIHIHRLKQRDIVRGLLDQYCLVDPVIDHNSQCKRRHEQK